MRSAFDKKKTPRASCFICMLLQLLFPLSRHTSHVDIFLYIERGPRGVYVVRIQMRNVCALRLRYDKRRGAHLALKCATMRASDVHSSFRIEIAQRTNNKNA